MNGKPFLDTNVLVYTLAKEDPRPEVARSLVALGGVVSVNILNEFVAVARRKYKFSWPQTREALQSFRVLLGEPGSVTARTHEQAIGIAERYGYHIYDALVIAAALEASCPVLYTEEMRGGQEMEGLTIRNPF